MHLTWERPTYDVGAFWLELREGHYRSLGEIDKDINQQCLVYKRRAEGTSKVLGQLLSLLTMFVCANDDLREKLTVIFEKDLTKIQATQAIKDWCQEVKTSKLTCFDPFTTTLDT